MRNLLVRRPTHEAMKVPRHSMIPVGDKATLAPQTSIGDRPYIDDFPFDCSRCEDDIICSLASCLDALRPMLYGNSMENLALAERTFRRGYFDMVCRTNFSVLPGSPIR